MIMIKIRFGKHNPINEMHPGLHSLPAGATLKDVRHIVCHEFLRRRGGDHGLAAVPLFQANRYRPGSEGQGKLIKEVMERKDKIISLSRREADRGKPVLLLLPSATDDPTEMLDIAREWRGDYNVFLYSYNYHARVEKVAADLTREMTRLKTENHGKVTVLAFLYSAIVFREAVILGAGENVVRGRVAHPVGPNRGRLSPGARAEVSRPGLFRGPGLASQRGRDPTGDLRKRFGTDALKKKFYEVINPQRMQTRRGPASCRRPASNYY